MKVDAGPLVRVRVQGASISSAQLQNLLPLYHDGATDDESLARSEKQLVDHFEREGYFAASVKATRTQIKKPQPHLEVLFRVNLGQRGNFAGYGVQGNKAVPTGGADGRDHPAAGGIASTVTHLQPSPRGPKNRGAADPLPVAGIS